jgi:cold shock CspA family protein/CRISPR/Cas system CSM-associated protein Csm3 (group 7 of RAMP superfamily)
MSSSSRTLPNPYDFIPLENDTAERVALSQVEPQDSWSSQAYSGHLVVQLQPLTPIFIHGDGEQHAETRVNPQTRQKSTIPTTEPRHFYRINNTLHIPATSLKGPLRAVTEAVVNGCLSQISEGYRLANRQIVRVDGGVVPGSYQTCGAAVDGLKAGRICRACALFGVTPGDQKAEQMPLGGRILISGARPVSQGAGHAVSSRWIKLPLPRGTDPKPRHTLFYRKMTAGHPGHILGRKFYFHHRSFEETLRLYRCDMPIEGVTCQFIFEVHFQNLSQEDLKLLFYVLELEPDLAHHIGYGKAFGLGSVRLSVAEAEVFGPTFSQSPGSRFLTYGTPDAQAKASSGLASEFRAQVDTWREEMARAWESRSKEAHTAFRSLFQYPDIGIYQYPSQDWFRSEIAARRTLVQYQQAARGIVSEEAAPPASGIVRDSLPQSSQTEARPAAQMSDRQRGTVKKFITSYGFIQRSGQPDLFVHISNVCDRIELHEGQEVEYSVGPGRRGDDEAKDVTPL